MNYKKIRVSKYIVEQLEGFTVNIVNTITGQIVASWIEKREFTNTELKTFYDYYKVVKEVIDAN